MGWAYGAELLGEVFDAVLPHIPEKKKLEVIDTLVEAFEDFDADTLCELSDYDDDEVQTYFAERYSDCDE